jgi:hypothetical protein
MQDSMWVQEKKIHQFYKIKDTEQFNGSGNIFSSLNLMSSGRKRKTKKQMDGRNL